jgi:hypothetical protein
VLPDELELVWSRSNIQGSYCCKELGAVHTQQLLIGRLTKGQPVAAVFAGQNMQHRNVTKVSALEAKQNFSRGTNCYGTLSRKAAKRYYAGWYGPYPAAFFSYYATRTVPSTKDYCVLHFWQVRMPRLC